jgi:hypothetical protein
MLAATFRALAGAACPAAGTLGLALPIPPPQPLNAKIAATGKTLKA